MNGNPHAANVLDGISQIEGMLGRRELYQRDGRGLILEAQSRMVVAHELRTANLLKFIATVPLSEDEYNSRVGELRERLGHG
jgi:hypothetical protein